MSSAEIRRQIHIQSEQKRRAQIKDGFDELRKHLPGCNNKKMSKAALLTRSKFSAVFLPFCAYICLLILKLQLSNNFNI